MTLAWPYEDNSSLICLIKVYGHTHMNAIEQRDGRVYVQHALGECWDWNVHTDTLVGWDRVCSRAERQLPTTTDMEWEAGNEGTRL